MFPSMWPDDPFRPFIKPASPFSPPRPYMPNPYASPAGYTSRYPTYPTQHFPHFPSNDASSIDLSTDTNTYFPHRKPQPRPDFAHFTPTSLCLPTKTARALHPNETLILPPSLTHLKISLYTTHEHIRTMRVAVAGDMRVRDVVKQVLPKEYLGDVTSFVKTRGEWVECGAPIKVGDVVDLGRFVVDGRGEVEVRIVVGRSDGGVVGRERGGGERGYGYEREMVGRMERMRVY